MKHFKNNYSYTIKLRCIVCGSENHFDCNENKSYIKCTNCGKEYYNGYDELVSYNQNQIEEIKEIATQRIKQDIQKDINQIIKKTFK